MKIISHRGLWNERTTQNSLKAFQNSMGSGFGIETDIRDEQGVLVISHNIPCGPLVKFDEFIDLVVSINPNLEIALNIKADGLLDLFAEINLEEKINNFYFFDMSAPEQVQYNKRGFDHYARHSDLEKAPLILPKTVGIWMDQFNEDWIQFDDILRHLENGFKVCLVSPELHGRNYEPYWSKWRDWTIRLHESGLNSSSLTMCTDHPNLARVFFDRR